MVYKTEIIITVKIFDEFFKIVKTQALLLGFRFSVYEQNLEESCSARYCLKKQANKNSQIKIEGFEIIFFFFELASIYK